MSLSSSRVRNQGQSPIFWQELEQSVLGQSRLAWLVVILALGVAASYLTSQLLLYGGLRQSTWMSIALRQVSGSSRGMSLDVLVNDEVTPSVRPIWESQGSHTFVGIRPPASATVRLQSLATPGGLVPLEDLLVPDFWTRTGGAEGIEISGAGLLGIPGSPQEVVLGLAGGPDTGSLEVDWNGRKTSIDLSEVMAGGWAIRLEAPDKELAWVLLPATGVDRIRVRIERADGAVEIGPIIVYGSPEQSWQPADLAAGLISLEGCQVLDEERLAQVYVEAGRTCEWLLPGLRPLNHESLWLSVALWLGILALSCTFAWLTWRVGRSFLRWQSDQRPEATRLGLWMERATARWSVMGAAAAVTVPVLIYHLNVALFVPIRVTPDSVGYYDLAMGLLRTHSLNAIDLYRTPGYPVSIALTIALLGHQVQGIVLFQHLALTLLAPVTVWFLYRRTNPLIAGLGGLLAGVAPILSAVANHVWSESPFGVLSCIALAVFVSRTRQPLGVLLAGALAGLATMVRPNGIVLVALMLGWLALAWWLGPPRLSEIRRSAILATVLVLGFLGVAAPWLINYHARAGRWGLATSTEFTIWNNGVIQGRSSPEQPINLPYRLFIEYPSSSGWRTRDPWAFEANAQRAGKPFPDGFYAESIRQSIRGDFRLYLENVTKSFGFNGLGRPFPDDSRFLSYPEVFTFFYRYRTREYPSPSPGIASPGDGRAFLELLAYRWESPVSRLRSGFLTMSEGLYHSWGGLNVLAFASFLAFTLVARRHEAVVLWLFVLATLLSTSLGGMAIDRYVMTVEPLLYLLMALGLYALLCCRLVPRKPPKGPP